MEQTNKKSTSSEGLSEDTKNIIVVLLLLFFWPAGVVLMWLWTQWPQWVKVLISAIAVGLVILSALFMIFWLFLFGAMFSRVMTTADRAIDKQYQQQEMEEQYQQDVLNATPSGNMMNR